MGCRRRKRCEKIHIDQLDTEGWRLKPTDKHRLVLLAHVKELDNFDAVQFSSLTECIFPVAERN